MGFPKSARGTPVNGIFARITTLEDSHGYASAAALAPPRCYPDAARAGYQQGRHEQEVSEGDSGRNCLILFLPGVLEPFAPTGIVYSRGSFWTQVLKHCLVLPFDRVAVFIFLVERFCL